MSSFEHLRALALAVDAAKDQGDKVYGERLADFDEEVTPEAVQAMFAELDALRKLPTAWTEVMDQSVELDTLRDAQLAWLSERDRLRTENEAFDDGLRELAFRLSAGGYNAETLTAAQLLAKVNWGVDSLASLSGQLVDRITAERTELRLQVGALRDVLQHLVNGDEGYLDAARSLLALLKGETRAHTIVPDERLRALESHNRMLLANAELHAQEIAEEVERTRHYIGVLGGEIATVVHLTEAAQKVLNHTEQAHRPPVRDDIETGRMVLVRLHALADLQDIVNTLERQKA
ncbi:hypothetical protein [Pseudomonas sp. NPDC090208]|uniref:hypothetical protein n=1 Tax=Pseudomonas sp. NPDC090208 TaxID=3364478 RepID=UPI00380A1CB4